MRSSDIDERFIQALAVDDEPDQEPKIFFDDLPEFIPDFVGIPFDLYYLPNYGDNDGNAFRPMDS